jgi:hypothetical protein
VPGVLVLVEQHRAVGGALHLADLGVGVGDARGDGELVGEVDRPLARFRATNASTSGSNATRLRCVAIHRW